jgi:hypothetical protein
MHEGMTTLQAIEAEHKRLGAMIEALKPQRIFPITVQPPVLADGETHICALISADGARCEHLILLPDEFEGTWRESLDWAESIGGRLPNRVEGALLFAHAKDEFKRTERYWLLTQVAAQAARFQYFINGNQGTCDNSTTLHARAIRRSRIPPLSQQVTF